jgi:hypothetical protein
MSKDSEDPKDPSDWMEDELNETGDDGEDKQIPRWSFLLIILFIGMLFSVLPENMTIGPSWAILAVAAAIMIPLLLADANSGLWLIRHLYRRTLQRSHFSHFHFIFTYRHSYRAVPKRGFALDSQYCYLHSLVLGDRSRRTAKTSFPKTGTAGFPFPAIAIGFTRMAALEA